MKVLLLRADNQSPNLGVRVLAEGTTALVRAAWGEDCIVHLQNYDGGDTGVSFNKSAVMRDVLSRNGPIRSTLRKYDVVIDVCGGDSFTDIYGMKRLALILYSQRTSQKLGVPTLLGPQTIGPFTGRISRALAARSLKGMSLVLARDRASQAEAAGLGRPVDLSATDVVFALPVPEVSKTRSVVINASGLLWNPNKHLDHVGYRDNTRALIREMLLRGHDVSVMPHVLDSGNSDNDVPVARDLAAEFGTSIEVIEPSSLAEARRITASARLLIGARMHACLNSLSTGTPAIPWAYSRKFAPLLDDIGWYHVVDPRTDDDPVGSTLAILDQNGDLDGLAEEASGVRARATERLDEVVAMLRTLSVEGVSTR
ncbi:Polysaccharide pyruvyl transferase family protein WcaK [Rathayibacter oskolensis]|uniref:Polysaccharide pyruvyl transferase family protein WcaK n=1 Tax=Rathayibacter oskolensis TaxID=1891671 RepID=A0A1X7NAZ9_9MICO|nr:polysaccharide pyruvyl transferase family protein [Rathayibacter oskolensis]SMH34772.1 Polysaccharide pyruvyl transferase family protein WcaK [Rathayibacter oskolensis]